MLVEDKFILKFFDFNDLKSEYADIGFNNYLKENYYIKVNNLENREKELNILISLEKSDLNETCQF